MKVLVFFQESGHSSTINELCKNLKNNGVEVSSFNITHWKFRNTHNKENVIWVRVLCFFAVIPKLRGLLTKLFRTKAMLKISENHTIIDIHFFSPLYDNIIKELKKRGKKIKINIWGSDFYRVDSTRREQQRLIYLITDIIQLPTQEIAKDFIKIYPEFESKIRISHFGIMQLDLIDELLSKGNREQFKKELNIPTDKIILTCGTNGSKGHRHIMMLESIERLAPSVKEKLFLIIPMTYGGSASYIQTIKQRVENLGLPYLLLTSYLTFDDLCKFRIVSDITLTIQETDALASAIQEHIYTGEILIAGEWLPYQALNEFGVFYRATSMESLTETISETVENSQELTKLCQGNSEKIAQFSSWSKVIKDWISIYNEIDK